MKPSIPATERNFFWLRFNNITVKRKLDLDENPIESKEAFIERKLKKLDDIQAYCERKKLKPHIDTSRSRRNRELFHNGKSMRDFFISRTESANPAANNALVLEVIASFSPGATPINLNRWIADNLDFFRKLFGGKNLAKAYLHMDENTPHIHVFFVPINSEGKFSFQKFAPYSRIYSKLHDQYAEVMKSHGLRRGIKGTRLFYSDMQRYHGFISMLKSDAAIPPPQPEEKTSHYRQRLARKCKKLCAKSRILSGAVIRLPQVVRGESATSYQRKIQPFFAELAATANIKLL